MLTFGQCHWYSSVKKNQGNILVISFKHREIVMSLAGAMAEKPAIAEGHARGFSSAIST